MRRTDGASNRSRNPVKGRNRGAFLATRDSIPIHPFGKLPADAIRRPLTDHERELSTPSPTRAERFSTRPTTPRRDDPPVRYIRADPSSPRPA
jgi:hypothetical protein